MANLSKTTQDHEEIQRWAEERGGKPAHVKTTGSKDDIGILRIDFPGFGQGSESLEEITWDQFFEKFDERNLSLVYQEETADGQKSNFNKLLSAETAAEAEKKSSRSSSRRGAKTASKKAAPAQAKKSASSSPPAKKAAAKTG